MCTVPGPGAVRSLSLSFVLAVAGRLFAQEPEPLAGVVALHQALRDAASTAVVLNVAAHPDDESSRTNTVLRRKHGMRIVTLYSTHGDGGQNAIGREIGRDLAALRVRETLDAAAMSDVEVRWLGMRDFGFSKTLEETLDVWGRDALLDAMRAAMDAVEPDLVFTNHTIDKGHGHHRASFWAVEQVLRERKAAGRPCPPLYVRSTPEEAQWTVDPAELDEVRGETWARMAWRSWTQHETQGPWGPHNPLQVGKDHWRVAWPEGVTVEQARVPHLWAHWVVRGPEVTGEPTAANCRPLAAQALQQLAVSPLLDPATPPDPQSEPLRVRTRNAVEAWQRVLMASAGVRIESWLDRREVAHGTQGRAYVLVHGVSKVSDLRVRCNGRDAEPAQVAMRSTPFDGMPAPPAGASPAGPVVPAPVQPAASGDRFQVAFDAAGPEHGDPVVPAWVTVDVEFTLDGVKVQRRLRHWYTPVPALEIEWDRAEVMVPEGGAVERILSATVRKHAEGELALPIRLAMGPGIRAEAIPSRIQLSAEHREARVLVRATIDPAELTEAPEFRIEAGDATANVRIHRVRVEVPPGLSIGLVRGPDDTVERAMADLGIRYVALDRDALAVARLEDFSTLLLDMRVYHHRPELAEVRDRILSWCRAGGRVVVLYHKPGEWNERPGHPLLAPFPLTVGDERACEEARPVVFLDAAHRLLTHPHAIGAADFESWVQERGLNFPSKWDAAWTPLLELQDASDKQPSRGALLYTGYGRGDFVHCSLTLYRQLRVGNRGAARILVNLLAR